MAIDPLSKAKMVFATGIVLGACMRITLVQAQPGAEEATTPPPAVKTFTIAPMQRSAAILMPNAQTPGPPAPLDSQTKSEILKSLGGSQDNQAPAEIKAQTQAGLEHLLLSAQQPFVSGKGLLTLALAYSVHPETSIKFNSNYPGSAAVKLKVDKGQTYLLDFAVRSSGSGTYLVETESGKQAFEDETGTRQHILVALSAAASGWTTIRLSRDGAEYYLYFVEVTRASYS